MAVKQGRVMEALRMNSPVTMWTFFSWSLAVVVLLCAGVLIGSVAAVNLSGLLLTGLCGVGLPITYLMMRNAMVSWGASRSDLDAIFKQAAYSVGSTALVAFPIFLALSIASIGLCKLLVHWGATLGRLNLIALVFLCVVVFMPLSSYIGWRLLGRSVYHKHSCTAGPVEFPSFLQ